MLSDEYLSQIEKELTEHYNLNIRINYFTNGRITFYIVNKSSYSTIDLDIGIDSEITSESIKDEINNKFETSYEMIKDNIDIFNKLYKHKIRDEKLKQILKKI